MVVIDTRHDIAYESVSKAEVARMVGVAPSTVFRWVKGGEKQVFNHFIVYVQCERVKQNKGQNWRRP